MRLDPTKEIETKDAFAAFMAFMRDQNPRFHMSKPDFRDGLERATNGAVTFRRSVTKEKKGRWVFSGLTIGNDLDGGCKLIYFNGQVIEFPSTRR